MTSGAPLRPREAPSFQERRKKADWVSNMAAILSLLSWIVAFAVWILLDMAAPEKANMFTQMLGLQTRDYWDSALLPFAFALLVASLCTCVLAFVFNALRKRRKTDKFKKSIIIAGAISLAGIVFFLIRFGVDWM